MTAQDILLNSAPATAGEASRILPQEAPLADVLAALAESDTGQVLVEGADGSEPAAIDMRMALQACATLIPPRPESSTVSIVCAPEEYSATALARAVEDADAQLTDLYTMVAPHGNLLVLMRTSRLDPSPVARSLRRYGFTVVEEHGTTDADVELARQRIEELRRYFDL